MRYCASCRIGTIDERGLCVLCGAPSTPPTRGQRLAEAGGAVLSTILSPGVGGAVLFLGLLLAFALLTHDGKAIPAGLAGRGVRGAPGLSAAAAASTLASVRTDPAGALVHLLLPALLQALLFSLLLGLVFFYIRRRTSGVPGPRQFHA